MKKIILIMLSVLILLISTSCGSVTPEQGKPSALTRPTERSSSDTTVLEDVNPEFADVDESDIRTFVFSKDSCGFIFTGTPDKAFYTSKNVMSEWNYVSVTSDGKTFMVKLTDELVNEWKEVTLSRLNEGLTIASEKEKVYAQVSDDYKTIVYDGVEVGLELAQILMSSALMQVLNSGDGDGWSIDITFRNYDTKNIVWEGNLPRDTVTIEDSDWIV